MVEFGAFKEKHKTLIKENNNNLEAIAKRKKHLILLQDQRTSSNVQKEVSICWKLSSGNCRFGVDKSWFIHSEESL